MSDPKNVRERSGRKAVSHLLLRDAAAPVYEGETEPIPRINDRGRSARHGRDEPDEHEPTGRDAGGSLEQALAWLFRL